MDSALSCFQIYLTVYSVAKELKGKSQLKQDIFENGIRTTKSVHIYHVCVLHESVLNTHVM